MQTEQSSCAEGLWKIRSCLAPTNTEADTAKDAETDTDADRDTDTDAESDTHADTDSDTHRHRKRKTTFLAWAILTTDLWN